MLTFLRDNAALLEAVSTFVAALAALIGLIYAGRQLRASRRSVQGEYLLHFDEMLDRYDKIHRRLRPGGDWASDKPIADEDWPDIERYMGLFERIKVLIDDGFIDIGVFDRLYGYRIRNIKANKTIEEEKLVKRAYGWQDFIQLAAAIDRHRERQRKDRKQ